MIQPLQQFFREWDELVTVAPDLRVGQAAANAVAKLHPQLARRLDGTELDCFYIDERLPLYLSYIVAHWVDPRIGEAAGGDELSL